MPFRSPEVFDHIHYLKFTPANIDELHSLARRADCFLDCFHHIISMTANVDEFYLLVVANRGEKIDSIPSLP